MLKITPGYDWIWSYLEIASRYVPRLWQVRSIRFRKAKFNQVQHVDASAEWNWKGPPRYDLTLFTLYNKTTHLRPYRMKRTRYSEMDLLVHLGHELAHITHPGHTPAHKLLESKIVTAFMRQLAKDGYVSEEKHTRRHFYRNGK